MTLSSLAAALCLLAPGGLIGPLPNSPYIAEFMASNSNTLLDGDGDASDWIEIHNPTGSSINLTGYHLTDDPLQLTKWTFPSKTLAANGRLIVWASDKGPAGPAGELHMAYKLSAGGDYLALVAPNGTTIVHAYTPTYPEQHTDISYGVNPAGGWTERYFPVPTPAAANNAGVAGIAQDTVFSLDRGFYDTSTSVIITPVPASASIRYTKDGSRPTATHGTLYTGPVTIDRTTVLRAVAFQTDWLPSNVDTQTYIFVNDVIEQPATVPGFPNKAYNVGNGSSTAIHDHEMDPEIVDDPDYGSDLVAGLLAIPTMSIVTDLATMYGAAGYYDQNDIEVPCSVEILYPNDPLANHQVDAGIEGHSHIRLKRTLRLNFRAEYGDSKWETDLFERAPFHGNTAVDRFDRVILRAGNNRSWARNWNPDKTSYAEDQFYRDTQLAATGFGMRGTFVHLYINGVYWGLYNPTERADHKFQAAYFGGEDVDYFAINHGGDLSGNDDRWDHLVNDLAFSDLTNAANYAELQEYLDVPAFCDYLIIAFWMGLGDWPSNNWYGGNRNATSPLGPGPGRFFAWDGEWCFNAPKGFSNPTGGAKVHPSFESDEGASGSSPDIVKIWHGARDNTEFMLTYADRAYALLFHGGPLSDAATRARWAALNGFIRDAVVAESARWGDSLQSLGYPLRTRDDDWQEQVDDIDDILAGNAKRMINVLRAEGYYPSIDPPKVDHDGGVVPDGFKLRVEAPAVGSAIWYTLDGTDPRAPGGLVAPGALNAQRTLEVVYPKQKGNGFSGIGLADAGLLLPITELTHFKARIKRAREWSALLDLTYSPGQPKLRLTEIMYNPAPPTASEIAAGFTDAEDFEWIELKNVGNVAVPLAGVALTDGITFSFAGAATPLGPGQAVVLVNDQAAFAQRYGNGPQIAGQYSGNLSNGGELLRLIDGAGVTLHAFTYDDGAGWPTTPDGGGPSLQVIDTEGNYGSSANWQAGPNGGTPGN